MEENGKKILIVEDEPDILMMVKSRLENCRFQVATVSDGDEAMDTIFKEKPDLVILDLMLPGAGGYELCLKIKQDKTLTSLPVIMYSSRVGDLDKNMGLSCGADGYVPKCNSFNKLLDMIDKFI